VRLHCYTVTLLICVRFVTSQTIKTLVAIIVPIKSTATIRFVIDYLFHHAVLFELLLSQILTQVSVDLESHSDFSSISISQVLYLNYFLKIFRTASTVAVTECQKLFSFLPLMYRSTFVLRASFCVLWQQRIIFVIVHLQKCI